MKEKFRNIPAVLQNQIIFRCGLGILFLILSMALLGSVGDWYLIFPCLICGGFLSCNGLWLFYQAVAGNYMRLQGECIRMETMGFRKRVRFLYLNLEQDIVKLHVLYRIRKLSKGDIVIVYVAEQTPVYEKEGVYIIGSYYAMEIQTDGNNGKGKTRR